MGMTIIHCDRCKHWTVGLFGVPNAKTGVADKHCKSWLPKECPDTVPEDLKGVSTHNQPLTERADDSRETAPSLEGMVSRKHRR